MEVPSGLEASRADLRTPAHVSVLGGLGGEGKKGKGGSVGPQADMLACYKGGPS